MDKISFFDTCYRYLILYDNDRLLPCVKENFYQKLKTIFVFPKTPVAIRHVQKFKKVLCRRENVKNIILFMYESIQKNGEQSPFFKDFENSKEIDSFVRLIYTPIRQLEAQEQHDYLSSL